MLAVQVQTPAFVFERATGELAARLPVEAMERLQANMRAFRSWVAEPAFREKPAAAVHHVLSAVGPAVQLKAEFLAVLQSVPQGMELFNEAVTTDRFDIVFKGDVIPGVVEAADLLERAQRTWLRFVLFHPNLSGVESEVGGEALGQILTLGFHADNLLTVCLMGTDGKSGPVRKAVLRALATAAAEHAAKYHRAVRDLVEDAAPEIDATHPFKPTTLADLLALPPHDGPAATLDELDEGVGSLFAPP